MADRDRGGDYDDWFDEPEAPAERRRRGQRRAPGEVEDDSWVAPAAAGRPRRPLVVAGREITSAQAAIVGTSAIVLLLAVLAAAGVFSGSTKRATPPLPTVTAKPPAVTPTEPTTPAATTPAAVQVPTATLKPGESGAEVTQLQRALAKAGYSPGKPDGSYGPATKQAVTSFQTAHGLSADGVAGPKTLAALQQAVGGG